MEENLGLFSIYNEEHNLNMLSQSMAVRSFFEELLFKPDSEACMELN